jgi:hypothetical protein
MKRARVLVLAALLALGGCSGVPFYSPRFSWGLEILEVPLGLVLLPFAIVINVIGGVVFHGSSLDLTLGALTLVNPFCNALGGTPSTLEVPKPSVELEVGAPPAKVVVAAREWLAREQFSLVRADSVALVGSRAVEKGVWENVSVEVEPEGAGARVKIGLVLVGSLDGPRSPIRATASPRKSSVTGATGSASKSSARSSTRGRRARATRSASSWRRSSLRPERRAPRRRTPTRTARRTTRG